MGVVPTRAWEIRPRPSRCTKAGRGAAPGRDEHRPGGADGAGEARSDGPVVPASLKEDCSRLLALVSAADARQRAAVPSHGSHGVPVAAATG